VRVLGGAGTQETFLVLVLRRFTGLLGMGIGGTADDSTE